MTADIAAPWADSFVLWGLNAALAATLVTAIALAAAQCARRSPALRYALLCSCLATLAGTPLLALFAPEVGFSLSAWTGEASPAPTPTPTNGALARQNESAPAAARVAETAAQAEAATLAPAAAPRNAAEGTPRLRLIDSDTSAAHAKSARGPALLPSSSSGRLTAIARQSALWLIAVWQAGTLIGLARLIVAWRRLQALVGAARPATGEAAAILVDCRRQLGIKREVALAVSDRIASPFATGLRSAFILLPADWAAQASNNELRAVLLHEAAHVVRRDPAIVLVQQLTAAFYWFHPLVRLFNARLAEAREETCDNHVLAAIDAPAYGRTLLGLTALMQPLRALPTAAGLFASRWRLEHRIAGLLDERRDRATSLAPRSKALVGALAIATAVGATLAAGTLARGQAPDQYAPTPAAAAEKPSRAAAKSAPPAETLARAAAAAQRTVKSIQTAHVRYRQTRVGGRFKPGITHERCLELLAKYNLAEHPEQLRDLLIEVLAIETGAAPWSEKELFTARPQTKAACVRNTLLAPPRASDVHVVTPELSLRWSDANSQLNVDAARDNRVGYTDLSDFWQPAKPAKADAKANVAHDRFGGRPVLRLTREGQTAFIDAETGFYLSVDGDARDDQRLRRWLGWRPTSNGAVFPTAVIDLQFADNQLSILAAYLVDEVRFNAPLSPATFVLGAPAGAVIVDSRDGKNWAGRINRDVFDASSVEQVKAATQPLEQPPTPTEQAAFADLRRTYVLPDGEALRRLGPPFPLSRNYLRRMLSPLYAGPRRETHSTVIEWKQGALGDSRMFYAGHSPTLGNLIEILLGQPPAAVDIPADVLNVELPGDFLVRSDATRDELAAALSTIVSQELGRPIQLQFQEVPREVYVARGNLTLDESELGEYSDRPLIAVNGGDYAGDQGEIITTGDLGRLLSDLSEYIHATIVNDTTASEVEFAWSKRWYDRDSTPAAQRFRLDPQTVLDLVSRQTGITFERQERTVNVLNLAKP